MPSTKHDIDQLSFQSIADQFVELIRRGEAPSIEEWVTRHPELEEEIRIEFPNLILLEQARRTNPRRRRNNPGSTPSRICGCEIQDEIGRGGMGVVFRAYQRELDRKVAIKVLYLDEMNRPNLIERFQLERKAMARLDHPNIVPVYDYGNDEKRAFLVMKYVDGSSLDRFVEPNPKSPQPSYFQQLRGNWKKIAILGAEVASALQHAHDNGMIHRDVKPANLILDRKGKVWITDFGLAKVKDYKLGLSQTGDTIGTPRYMAPEQFRGISEQRSDVYALGLSLYEIASGKRAWMDLDANRIASQRSVLEVPNILRSNGKVPKGLAEIIMKACAHRPEDRYQTAAEFQIVLERFANGCAVGDRRSSPRNVFSIIRRASIRNKILGVGIGVATMAVCALVMPKYPVEIAARKPESPPVETVVASEAKRIVAPAGHEQFTHAIVEMGNASRSPDPNMQRKAMNEAFEMIDEVRKDKDLVKDTAEIIKESIVSDAGQYGIAQEEQKELLAQVDRIRDNVASADFSRDRFKKFVDTYKNSALPVLQRVNNVERLLGRSGLTLQERNAGVATLQSIVSVASANKVSKTELENLFLPIEQSRGQDGRYVIADNQLRMWLKGAKAMVQSKVGNASGNISGLADELKTMVDNSLENHR